MRMMLFLTFLAGTALAVATGCRGPAREAAADTIYTGGNIITINDAAPSAEALAVKDGKILAVGANAEVLKTRGERTTLINLDGKTLIPGFIDAWSHIGGAALTADLADLSFWSGAAPVDINGIIGKLKEYQKQHALKEGEWIAGWGYDPTYLKENRHPDRADLDAAFPNNPVGIVHLSGLMGVTNSAGLRLLGISAASKDPAGGTIFRKPGSREPTGLLQGTALSPLSALCIGTPTMDQLRGRLRKVIQTYATNGITTAQDGGSLAASLALFKEAGARGELAIDVVALPGSEMADSLITGEKSVPFGVYKDHWKLGGIVMMADGAPQERTALFTKPYLTSIPGKGADYRGIALAPQEELDRVAKLTYANNIQYIGYGNGDGGIDMHLLAIERAVTALKDTGQNHRTVILHSQFVRDDQLDTYKRYQIMPSLFTNHAYMFGDVHVENLGKERAYFLSPMKTAASKGLLVTNHTDYISAPPAPLFAVWTAVNRVSRSGVVIGPDERVTPYEALRAMTVNVAYMYFEEATKGSLEVGKRADLVVLDRNPLTVDPMTIKDIKVVQTIKDGKTIYTAP